MRKFLRDIVSDQQGWERQVARLRSEKSEASSLRDNLSILGRLGDQLRLTSGTRAEALLLLRRAVQLAKSQDDVRFLIANQIRLATALQYSNEYKDSIQLFENTLSLILRTDSMPLLDYGLQHVGKCLVEVGEVQCAIDCFRQALRLRRERNDLELIDSTLEALAAVEGLENSCVE